ncbi:NAD(P)/FAD-dependent oxidoreductase [candidate division WOR-3 bacterium]|nr:NAD(P)/FAD-dependent oxidoreductase [candidate division WOR-3 bacterium]
MKRIYDVVVVGAGPVGSYTAYQLADKGLSVALIDAKKEVGNNVICAGVLSKEAFKRYDLPGDSILSRIDTATFVSPGNKHLVYQPKEIFCYVVDRKTFDHGLFRQAANIGCDVFLQHRVTSVREAKAYYSLYGGKKVLKTRTVVLATGVNYDLHSKLGLNKPPRFIYGSQIELPMVYTSNDIQIHLGQDIAPNSFGWVIPAGDHATRIGVLTEHRGKTSLKQLLEQRLNISVSKLSEKELFLKPIAYGGVKRSVKGKILAVGEAAGQVKTTTGGGIFYGLLCSEIAVDKIFQTLNNGKDLTDYDLTWHSALASELDIGIRLRKIANKLSNKDIENLFDFVKKHRFWVDLLVPRLNFDYHSNFIYFCLKSFGSLIKLPKE